MKKININRIHIVMSQLHEHSRIRYKPQEDKELLLSNFASALVLLPTTSMLVSSMAANAVSNLQQQPWDYG